MRHEKASDPGIPRVSHLIPLEERDSLLRNSTRMLKKSDERTLWRLRLIVARAAQDCGVMHHQLHDLGALLDGVIEKGAISSVDLVLLERLAATVARCADDCSRTEHCDFVRADLVCELRELSERLRDSLLDARVPELVGQGDRN
jgi:hypothetical protein